ncbi:MAG TPA: hypothetical protein VK636_22570 [Gemmatimonadaceae bacterium]|nr:hypothetical protein [Gemmatimonadaceae bacterium]
MRVRASIVAAAVAASAHTLPLLAQQSGAFDFSIKSMMRGPEVFGREPQNVRWSADGK